MKDINKIIQGMESCIHIEPAVVRHSSPFKVLVSTILSQRTRDGNTALASKQLFVHYGTPKKLLHTNIKDIEQLIRPAGFYKTKAKRIREISKILVERYAGKVPEDINHLLSLPGVGRKTANCVLVFAFGKPAIPVDVHVHRISNRIGIVKTRTPEGTEAELMRIIPRDKWVIVNHLFVSFGQQMCLPQKPRCKLCPIAKRCGYFHQIASRQLKPSLSFSPRYTNPAPKSIRSTERNMPRKAALCI